MHKLHNKIIPYAHTHGPGWPDHLYGDVFLLQGQTESISCCHQLQDVNTYALTCPRTHTRVHTMLMLSELHKCINIPGYCWYQPVALG